MNFVSLIKNNILLITVFVTQTLMLLVALGEQKHINTINIDTAILYHLIITAFFCIGCLLLINVNKPVERGLIIKINKAFYYLSFGLTTIGLFTSVITVGYVYSIKDYLALLLHYQENQDLLRHIKSEVTNGSISGVFKVLNYTPLGVFFVTSSFLIFYKIRNRRDNKMMIFILIYAALCSLLKTFFSLDRLTLLGMTIVMLYSFFIVNRRIKFFFVILLLFIFLLLSFITSAKMSDMSVYDFIKLYCQLGLTNFELLIEKQMTYSFGFNTFLMPLYFIAKFFNLIIDVPSANSFILDNAQYFYGYLYLDFGIFSFVVMFLIGALVGKYQNFVNLNKKTAVSVFFVVLFALCTFIVVPIIRGVEFWWLLFVCFFLSFFIVVQNDDAK